MKPICFFLFRGDAARRNRTTVKSGHRTTIGPPQSSSKSATRTRPTHGCGRLIEATMSPDGSAPRFCRFSSRRKSFTGASGAAATWCATEMGVGGFSSPFRGQERWLRLKTNARGVPVSARCCRYQRANNCDGRRSGTLRLSRSPPRFGGRQMRPIAAFVGRGRAATPNVQGLGN